MNEGFAGAGQGGDQSLHGAAMIARGGIDHRIGGSRFNLQDCRVIQPSDNGLDAMPRNQFGFGLAPD